MISAYFSFCSSLSSFDVWSPECSSAVRSGPPIVVCILSHAHAHKISNRRAPVAI